jgi:WD40 repeat protein
VIFVDVWIYQSSILVQIAFISLLSQTSIHKYLFLLFSYLLGVLDVKRKEYLTLVRSHTGSIVDISIDMTCRYIATCSTDSTIRVWGFDTCRQLYDFSTPNERPTRLSFFNGTELSNKKNSSVFACGFNSGKIRVFNVDEAKLVKEISSPHQLKVPCEITDLKYCQNGKRLLIGDSLRYLCLYDVEREYSLIRLLPGSISSSGSLSVSQDSKNIAIIGPTDYLISIFDSLNLNEILRINIITNTNTNIDSSNANITNASSMFENIASVSFSKDAALRLAYAPQELNQLVCVTSSNKLLKFDSRNGRLLSSIQRIHRSLTDCVTVSSDGVFLVTSGDNCIKIWDYQMRLEKNYQAFVGHSSPVNQVLFTHDNRYLISVGDSIIIWDFLAYTSSHENNCIDKAGNSEQMPQGRSSALIKPNTNLLREVTTNKPKKATNGTKKRSYENPGVNDINEINVLNEISFEQMRKSRTNINSKARYEDWSKPSNESFERPRTPPVATDIQIETITVGSEIEDTFLNDEDTLTGHQVNQDQNQVNFTDRSKKFINLPNLMGSNDQEFMEKFEKSQRPLAVSKIEPVCANMNSKLFFKSINL